MFKIISWQTFITSSHQSPFRYTAFPTGPVPASLNFAVLEQNNIILIQRQRNFFHFLDKNWKQPLASPDLNGPGVGNGMLDIIQQAYSLLSFQNKELTIHCLASFRIINWELESKEEGGKENFCREILLLPMGFCTLLTKPWTMWSQHLKATKRWVISYMRSMSDFLLK